AERLSPVDTLPVRSLTQPAAAGPMVWPNAKSVVAAASALPQAPGARLPFTEPVTADGTINSLTPTSASDRQIPARLGNSKGKIAPIPSVVMAAAMGTPLVRP